MSVLGEGDEAKVERGNAKVEMSGEPELGFEAEVGGGVVVRGGASAGHFCAFLAACENEVEEKLLKADN